MKRAHWIWIALAGLLIGPAVAQQGGGVGVVTSIFGRAGNVTATSGDYTVAQVTGAAPLANPSFTGIAKTAALQDTNYAAAMVPTTGTTVIIADGKGFEPLNPAATLATLTLQLPTCSPTYDGLSFTLKTSQIITAVTVTATAGSVGDAPAVLAIGQTYTWKCFGGTATWW